MIELLSQLVLRLIFRPLFLIVVDKWPGKLILALLALATFCIKIWIINYKRPGVIAP
jgi:hypothetical protein